MQQVFLCSDAKTLALLSALLIPAAALADPASKAAKPADASAIPQAKPPVLVFPNAQMTRMPKTYLVFGLKSDSLGHLLLTNWDGSTAMTMPSPRTTLMHSPKLNVAKAAAPLLPNTTQSAPR